MLKVKTKKILTALLVLLIIPLLSPQVFAADDDEPENNSIISGILAHEMNETEAKILSSAGFHVEADVRT